MRVRIVFLLKNKGAVIPFHHQHLLSKVVSQLLGSDANATEQLSLVHFSGLKGQTKVTNSGLCFYSNKVTLVFSSLEKQVVDTFLQHLFRLPELKIGSMVLVPETVSVEENPAFEEASRYICISPIVLLSNRLTEQEIKRFVSPDTDTFSDFLYESTMIRMEDSGRFTKEQMTAYFRFQVVPDQEYLERLRISDKKFARIYSLDEKADRLEVRGYTFPFTLYAHPEVHQFLFQSGLGEFTSEGYGMIDLAEQGFQTRLTPYILPIAENRVDRNFLPRERVA
jgi:CRISPR-associated endoribonuclease Cas6